MISKDDLPDEVVAIGLMTGILTEVGTGLAVNADWFKNPFDSVNPSLKNIDQRLNSLVSLVNSIIGPGVANPPPVFTGAQWYALPNSDGGTDTPFHLVSSPETASSGQLGLGVLYSVQSDNLSITVYIYVPLLSYGPGGATFITDSLNSPCVGGLRASTVNAKGFQSGQVSFSALEVEGSIYLNPAAYQANPPPSYIKIFFDQLKGTTQPATYTTLSSLLNTTVESWIGTVILQGNSWLNLFIGEAPVTFGNILAAGDFVSVDNQGNYSLSLDSLSGLTALDIAIRFLFSALKALSDTEVPYPVFGLPGGGLYAVRRVNNDGSMDFGFRLSVKMELVPGQSATGHAPRSLGVRFLKNSPGVMRQNRRATLQQPRVGKASQRKTASPVIDLCLGTWLTGEDDTNNWFIRSVGSSSGGTAEPGLSIFGLHCAKNLKISFAPSFTLSSVGINIKGADNSPLVNLNGFTLKGGELRIYFDSTKGTFGVAARLDSLGFPLGPNFGQAVHSSTTNPVAQSLLQSGSATGGGDQDPINPAFSLSAAYVEIGSFVVQLYDRDDTPAEQVLFPIQRALGPLFCQSLGLGWVQDTTSPANDILSLLFNGGISRSGLNIDLTGLSVDIPVTTPTDFSRYVLDLNGLDITLASGEVELSAALVKVPPDPTATPPRNFIEYEGEALLKGGTFSITALGSYAYVPGSGGQNGYASLFIFGILDADLGGPAFFYVTGLAAGFGYNRALLLPDQNSVTTFPLVAAASDPTKLGAVKQPNGSWQMPDPATALALLDQYVPPQRGEYWLAAGVRFTSFDLINSTALLVVEFGNELEIALLGLSWISLPPPAAPGAAAPSLQYLYAELGLEVKLLPSEGLFSATAILSPNSFVIDPACKLTGGFAFYVWFGDNPHAGEFVLTLGGYHPDFKPPGYYPQVPALGFNWPLPGNVIISGDAYFALTPSAIMAGAGLQVLYNSSNLKAWFKAQMDALVQWAPFHYLLDISVSLGASYRAHLLFITVTLKVELGADLTLWGPPMGGKVHVNWYVISFTVNFGAPASDEPPPLDWVNHSGTGFAQTLLPHQSHPGVGVNAPLIAGEITAVAALASGSVQPGGVYTITANSGLLNTITRNGATIWAVRPNNFAFSIQTTLPLTRIEITPALNEAVGTQTTFIAQKVSPAGSNYYVCIRPMKTTLELSVLTITLTRDDDNSVYDLAGELDFDLTLNKVPAAKWGKPLPEGQTPEMNAMLDGWLLGLANITPRLPALTPSGAQALDIDVTTAFTYDVVDKVSPYNPDHLPLQTGQSPVGTVPKPDDQVLQTIKSSLMDSKVVATRNAIFTALQEYGINPVTNGSLNTLAGNPGAYLTGNPLVATTTRHGPGRSMPDLEGVQSYEQC